ncbi:MAG: hypothetical protein SOS24_03910 [Clostridia bacterium]|nr:hypothetical protein [Clostridia bacterium]
MKKVILMILSLAMMFSGAIAVPVSAADFAIDSGYTFVDIAHNGDTYVALAKDASWTGAKLYCSEDGGLTWTSVRSIGNALVSSNKPSQQQLVYWAEAGVFVVHCATTTLTSTDGKTWIGNAVIQGGSNEVITTSGGYLIGGLSNAVSAIKTTETNMANNQFSTYPSSYPYTIAASTVKDGQISVLLHNQNKLCSTTLNTADNTWSTSVLNNNTAIPSSPIEMIYNEPSEQFMSIDGTSEIFVTKGVEGFAKIYAPGNVTAIASNSSYIVIGTGSGEMYYTANSADGINADTEWTQISTKDGTTVCSEPVRKIEFSGSNKFIALSKTQIYTCDTTQYCNVKEYVEEYLEIGSPEVTAANPFDGVRLIGGTYSPSLNKYIVYGDTTKPDANNKYWGKIFISSNGTDWTETYTGYTFSKRNFNEDGSIKSYTEVRNGAVWWESQGHFIVSASTSDHSGVSLVSTDGISWKAILMKDNKDADGNLVPELDTDFRLNTDIVVSGDKLYTTNNGRQFRTYTAWNSASMTYFGVTNVSKAWYMNQIAVSDDADPAVFMAQNGNCAVRNNDSKAENELDKWKGIDAVASSGAVTDAVFSKNLKKFVAVSTAGYRTSIVGKDGTYEQGPVVTGNIVCSAIDTNGSEFMFAGKDGYVYTAPDTANFKLGEVTLSKVPAASNVKSANTMPFTNVFKAGDKFIATSTDDTDSDVIFMAKNSDGTYEYVKASECAEALGAEAGKMLSVKVNGINKTSSDYTFDLISAVYSNGVLVQVQKTSHTIEAGVSGTVKDNIKLNDDIPSGSVMKVYMWDSVSGMKPRKAAVTPF